MSRLWLWTWSPAAMSQVAKPITCPYRRTTSPACRARRATLCPGLMSWRTSMQSAPSSSSVPAASGARATATSSSGLSTMAFSLSAYLAMSVLSGADVRTGALDAQHRALDVELDGRVVDAEARVEHGVQRLEQALALTHIADDDVR